VVRIPRLDTTSTDWRRGHDMEALRLLAAPFKAHYAPFVFGAFGIPRERDMAEALSAGRVAFLTGPEDLPGADVLAAPRAVLVAAWLKTPSRQQDFTGVTHILPAGDLLISDAAHLPGRADALASLVETLVSKATQSNAVMWWELFEEDAPTRALAERLGFAWAFTKIMAGSEIKGMYRRPGVKRAELPNAEAATLTRARDITPAALLAMRAELAAYTLGWAIHYSSYNKRQSWTAFCLRGYDAEDAEFIIKPTEMSKAWKAANPGRLMATPAWTNVAATFPDTCQFLNLIPGQLERVRFMRLRKDGGELTRHADITDRDAGIANGKIARLHVPIHSNASVQFRAWTARGVEQTEYLAPGGLWYLDQRKPHAVVNPSGHDRVHLVIDVVSSSALRQFLRLA
jgi:Aspartyl/Asparaginyl beta-hydroxylase